MESDPSPKPPELITIPMVEDEEVRDFMCWLREDLYRRAIVGMYTEQPGESLVIIDALAVPDTYSAMRIDCIIKRRLLTSMLTQSTTSGEGFRELIWEDDDFRMVRKYYPDDLEALIQHSVETLPAYCERMARESQS